MSKSLAIKYRPTTFEGLTEQSGVVKILTNQIETNTIKHGYLFVGAAGTGKTTSARIFANMINKGAGTPIELDAASNNSVEDIRELTEQAQTKSIDSEYKVFVIDECHMLSNSAWNAFLKTLEEPPAKSIFILCTTNPERIPQTILSRVQRYNFQRISQEGICNRLQTIIHNETQKFGQNIYWENDALEYLAKIADGGMRDAITLMDKCLSYSSELTLDNVVKALGVADYGLMFDLNNALLGDDPIPEVISIIDNVYNSGLDLKLFVKSYFEFILDMNIWAATNSFEATKIPATWIGEVKTYGQSGLYLCHKLLKFLIDLQNVIKWEQNPKAMIIAKFIVFIESEIVE